MSENSNEPGAFLTNKDELIDQQFENLGNIIGDFLLAVELSSNHIKNNRYLLEVQSLVDYYAELGDTLIDSYKKDFSKAISDLASKLLTDISKINTEEKSKLLSFPDRFRNNSHNLQLVKNDENIEKVSKACDAIVSMIAREKDGRLQDVVENFKFKIILKDSDNNILYLSNAAANSIGLIPSDFRGKNMYDLFPQFAKINHENDLKTIEQNKPTIGTREEFISSDGRYTKAISIDRIPILHNKDKPLIISIVKGAK
jgi:PAS domain S-box-containing protein